jgi:glutaconate CoA-transferase subunit A
VRDLTLVSSPPSSFDTDLLIGSGAVKKGYLPHVSFEHLGLAPNLRRAAEQGSVELVECDEATLLGGLMATLEGLNAHPVSSLKGSDHLKTSPLAVPYTDPTGEKMVAPPALRLDVAIVHAQEADVFGNVRCLGTPFCDPILVKAADYVVVTVDRLVSNEQVRAEPHRTTLPAYLIDAVVEIPYGAHPCSSHGLYPHDEHHLLEYLAAARAGGGAMAGYLDRFVTEPDTHEEYLATVGGAERLAELTELVP